ncbi:hypothetical protein HKX48_007774 [Thoreauomyces humboldtii]|nr:hypothetical protein HKX48_007774 [Thoreauomyces humboldtii]
MHLSSSLATRRPSCQLTSIFTVAKTITLVRHRAITSTPPSFLAYPSGGGSSGVPAWKPKGPIAVQHKPTQPPRMLKQNTFGASQGLLPTDAYLRDHPDIRRDAYGRRVAETPFTKAQAKALGRAVKVEELEIDQDRGYIYLKESVYQQLLDEAFGPEGWNLVPLTPFQRTPGGRTLYRAYVLQVEGRFVSEALGDWSIASAGGEDAAKSKCDHAALVRLGKDIGMAYELWDPTKADALRDERWKVDWVAGQDGKKKKVWVEK